MKKSKKIIATLAFVAAFASGSFGAVALKEAKADLEETTAFEMIQGASIRLAETTGLRFQVKIGQQEYKTITQSDSIDLGMMILPQPYVTAYEAAKASDATLTYHAYFAAQEKTVWDNVIADDMFFMKSDLTQEQQVGYEDNYYYASGVISEVRFNNYNRNLHGLY